MADQPLVLIVENEVLITASIEQALAGAGFTLVTASDGMAAERLLEAGGKDIRGLVTDIRLGAGPSGWDLARQGRQITADLPVIYITGADGDHVAERVPESLLIRKPFAVDDLVTAVSSLLASTTKL